MGLTANKMEIFNLLFSICKFSCPLMKENSPHHTPRNGFPPPQQVLGLETEREKGQLEINSYLQCMGCLRWVLGLTRWSQQPCDCQTPSPAVMQGTFGSFPTCPPQISLTIALFPLGIPSLACRSTTWRWGSPLLVPRRANWAPHADLGCIPWTQPPRLHEKNCTRLFLLLPTLHLAFSMS